MVTVVSVLVLVLQISPDHVLAATVLSKQLSPVAQHETTVVDAAVALYDAVHEVAVVAHE